jgi:hypothetical protein
MKKTSGTLFAAALAASLAAGAADAATLDFIGFTDNFSGEKAVEGNFAGDTLFNATYVPIATTARGYSGSAAAGKTGDSPFAYLDGNSAGLGVCKVLSGTQCTPSDDDNLTTGEILGISFAETVFVESLSFRGENHPNDPSFDIGDLFDISYDGGLTWLLGEQLINAKDGVFAVNRQIGAGTEILLAFNNEQYYLSAASVAPVPLPPALVLLGSALGGLGFMSRRRAA